MNYNQESWFNETIDCLLSNNKLQAPGSNDYLPSWYMSSKLSINPFTPNDFATSLPKQQPNTTVATVPIKGENISSSTQQCSTLNKYKELCDQTAACLSSVLDSKNIKAPVATVESKIHSTPDNYQAMVSPSGLYKNSCTKLNIPVENKPKIRRKKTPKIKEKVPLNERHRAIRPKVVEEKGAIQCTGMNLKKGIQCRNAALMEFIGPRPVYCAEHIELDPNSIYIKCRSSYGKFPGDGKGCKEVVLQEFLMCYKHFDDRLNNLPEQEKYPYATKCLARVQELLSRLEVEALAAKKKRHDLFQRKNKLIPKFAKMKSTLVQFLATLTGNPMIAPFQETNNFNNQIQYFPAHEHNNQQYTSSAHSNVQQQQQHMQQVQQQQQYQQQQMHQQQMQQQQVQQQQMQQQQIQNHGEMQVPDYFGVHVNQEDTFQELSNYLGYNGNECYDPNQQYLAFNNDYLSLPPLPLGKEFCLDEEWKSLFTD